MYPYVFMYDGSVSALTDLANWGPSGPDWTTKIFRTGPKGPEQCCFLLKVGNHSLYTFLLKNSALGHINITIILARRSIGILNWVFMFPSFTCANKSSFCGSFHVETCLTRAMLHIDFVLSIYKIVLYTFLLKIVFAVANVGQFTLPSCHWQICLLCQLWSFTEIIYQKKEHC